MEVTLVSIVTRTLEAVGLFLGSHCNMSVITLIPSSPALVTMDERGVGTMTGTRIFMLLARATPSLQVAWVGLPMMEHILNI